MKILKIISLIVLVTLSGCSSARTEGATSLQPIYEAQEYRIQPGDLLDIKFFYSPELNEQLTVRPDGKITLQLVNEVVAAGLTPRELTEVLTRAYSNDLAKPKIAVIVRTPMAAKVHVDGEVNKAGFFTLTGPMTVLQSIAQAGGMKESAEPTEVLVLRRAGDNRVKVIRVNLETVLEGEDATQDITLMPNDIVYVPRSTISNINAWVDKYLRKNVPLPIGVGYSID